MTLVELLPPDGMDAVGLGGASGRHLFALKSMDKRAMEERNKVRCACCGVLSWLSRSTGSLPGRPACPAPPLPPHSMLGAALRPRPETSTGLPAAAAYPAYEPSARLCPAAQVGRVRTEETILRSVDHPYLAKLYATIQTGAPRCCGRAKTSQACTLARCMHSGRPKRRLGGWARRRTHPRTHYQSVKRLPPLPHLCFHTCRVAEPAWG